MKRESGDKIWIDLLALRYDTCKRYQSNSYMQTPFSERYKLHQTIKNHNLKLVSSTC